MQVTGNTILITGGGSGIGRALAIAFHQRGNTVIVTGRRQVALDALASEYPGIVAARLDVDDPADIQRFAEWVGKAHPALNVLINNAGIMQPESWRADPVDLAIAEAIITTNLLGPLRLVAALLPQLRVQPAPVIMTVSSGLAFLPLTLTPTYCATKAAIHSFSQSLRYQLKDEAAQVIEIVPPYVQTELMGERQAQDPMAMPLVDFIDEVMSILETQPDVDEVLVKRVDPLRFSAEQGVEGYRSQFLQFNGHFHA
ncbi:SDR family oxidoreductase [Frateuria aurantia]